MSLFRRAVAALVGFAGAAVNYFRAPRAQQQRPTVAYESPARRVREKGRPGRAGDKLARMAAEGRLTIRKGW